MSKGEKLTLVLTVLLILTAAILLLTAEQGAGRYSISAKPEPEPTPKPPTEQTLLDLNTATAEALAALPGIGPVRARRIVAYREENGPFAYIEDVMDVYGIGEGIFEEFSTYVTVE